MAAPKPGTSSAPAAPHAPEPASIARRLASMLYESVLAFAILFAAGLLFHAVAGGRPPAGLLRHAFQLYLLAVLGLYFVSCWHRGGQTLPMKTWKIRVVSVRGGGVSVPVALLRFALACVSVGLAGAGFLWAVFDRDGQFLHDRFSGTRIVQIEE